MRKRITIWGLLQPYLSKHIVAAFRGMHVSPAKHSLRDYQENVTRKTHGQTVAGQIDSYVPLCFGKQVLKTARLTHIHYHSYSVVCFI